MKDDEVQELGQKRIIVGRSGNLVELTVMFLGQKTNYEDITTLPPKTAAQIGIQLCRMAAKIDPAAWPKDSGGGN